MYMVGNVGEGGCETHINCRMHFEVTVEDATDTTSASTAVAETTPPASS
jgi:hypothetical protein